MTSLLWPTMQRYQCPQRKKEICAQRHTQGECHVKTQRHAEGSQSCEDGGREWNYAANPQSTPGALESWNWQGWILP